MTTDNAKSGGIGIIGLLQVGLIIAKVCNFATISWWWVFSPTLIIIGIILLALVLVFVLALIKMVIE